MHPQAINLKLFKYMCLYHRIFIKVKLYLTLPALVSYRLPKGKTCVSAHHGADGTDTVQLKAVCHSDEELSARNQVWPVLIEKSAYACKHKLWKQTFWWGAETHSSGRLGGYSINKNSMGVSLSTVTTSTPLCRHPVPHPLTSRVMLHVFSYFWEISHGKMFQRAHT